MKERAKYRRLLSNEEKHYEKFIQKKTSKENEEVKNLIQSYHQFSYGKEIKEEKKENENEIEKEEKIEVIGKKENLLKLLLIDKEEERKIEEEKEKEKEKE